MEVTESIGSPDNPKSPDDKPNETVVSDDQKRQLFEKLAKFRSENSNKSLTLAMTIQTMFKENLSVLIELFEFYLEMNELNMADDLCENDIFKNFNLNQTSLFDSHLNNFSEQIIYNLSVKSLANRSALNQTPKPSSDEIYFKLFLKFSSTNQDKLVQILLERYKSIFSFFKVYAEINFDKKQPVGSGSATEAISPFQNIDFKEFYIKLAKNKQSLFEFRDLLLIYRKFIPEYGKLKKN